MYIFLPSETSGLRDLESKIHKLNYTELDGNMADVILYLPRFKIESKIDLESTLKKVIIKIKVTHSKIFYYALF